jgi:hypothetical protein
MSHILVIDDDPDLLSVCRVGLAAFGHDVRTAETGTDGLRAAAVRPPDVIVLDLGLPDAERPFCGVPAGAAPPRRRLFIPGTAAGDHDRARDQDTTKEGQLRVGQVDWWRSPDAAIVGEVVIASTMSRRSVSSRTLGSVPGDPDTHPSANRLRENC